MKFIAIAMLLLATGHQGQLVIPLSEITAGPDTNGDSTTLVTQPPVIVTYITMANVSGLVTVEERDGFNFTRTVNGSVGFSGQAENYTENGTMVFIPEVTGDLWVENFDANDISIVNRTYIEAANVTVTGVTGQTNLTRDKIPVTSSPPVASSEMTTIPTTPSVVTDPSVNVVTIITVTNVTGNVTVVEQNGNNYTVSVNGSVEFSGHADNYTTEDNGTTIVIPNVTGDLTVETDAEKTIFNRTWINAVNVTITGVNGNVSFSVNKTTNYPTDAANSTSPLPSNSSTPDSSTPLPETTPNPLPMKIINITLVTGSVKIGNAIHAVQINGTVTIVTKNDVDKREGLNGEALEVKDVTGTVGFLNPNGGTVLIPVTSETVVVDGIKGEVTFKVEGPEPTAGPSPGSKGLGGGAIAGIVIAVIVALVAGVAVAGYLVKKKRTGNRTPLIDS